MRADSLVIRQGGRDYKDGVKRGRGGGRPEGISSPFGRPGKAKKGEVIKIEPPKVFQSSPVIYNGKEVARVNGTLEEYKVDIWSGAHPLWQGKKSKVLLDVGSVTKFQEKFSSMADIFGDAGLDVLRKNQELKKEQEARKAAGLKSY